MRTAPDPKTVTQGPANAGSGIPLINPGEYPPGESSVRNLRLLGPSRGIRVVWKMDNRGVTGIFCFLSYDHVNQADNLTIKPMRGCFL